MIKVRGTISVYEGFAHTPQQLEIFYISIDCKRKRPEISISNATPTWRLPWRLAA